MSELEIDNGGTAARPVGRRALLRRAGTAVAVAGGAAAAAAAMGGTAEAAAGGNLVLGQANDAGTATTTVTSAAGTGATVVLANSGTRAPLALAGNGTDTLNDTTLEAGEMFTVNGDLFYVPVGASDGGPIPALVFNELTALQLVPIVPMRMLDTRTTAGRAHIVDGTLDAAHRTVGGTWLTLDVSSMGVFFDAVVGNLTVTGPVGGGFIGIGPAALAGPATTSTINYGNAQTIANGFTTAVNLDDGTLAIYSQRTTHVILDVAALNAPGPDWIVVPHASSAAARASAMRAGFARMAARRG